MPGWIIQGVRGEGKSLAAVGKIKEYLEQGRPVATNLDLNLDNLLDASNNTPCYRLPDHPRAIDFELLPPAYDPKYKAEDRNGLLVLDELGTWLNSRSWNDKGRLALLNWLFLSRKDHWDLILLAQDAEMIDAQVRNTLCDFLVVASRMDRQKIPYLAPLIEFLGFSAFMPKIHVYSVFYGFSTQVPPVERWRFTGKDLYAGYDTNQRFRNGSEALNGSIVDMRCLYQYLPPAYLTNQVHIDKHLHAIEHLKRLAIQSEQKNIEDTTMAVRKGTGGNPQIKAYLLIIGAVIFLGWRFFSGGIHIPDSSLSAPAPVAANITPPVANVPVAPVVAPVVDVPVTVETPKKSVETVNFMDVMLTSYRPRLSTHGYSEDTGFLGYLEWYDGQTLVEKLSLKDLHAFGVALVKKSYGLELVYGGKSYPITAWPKQAQNQVIQVAKNP